MSPVVLAGMIAGLGLAALLVGCSENPRPVARFADDLREAIPSGWTVSVSGGTIRIASDREMIFYSPMSTPPFGTLEEHLRDYGRTKKYVLNLSFVPRMTTVELDRLKEERALYERILAKGVSLKSEWGAAVEGVYANRPPRFHTGDWSIFDDRPNEAYGIEIHPAENAAMARALLDALDEILGVE